MNKALSLWTVTLGSLLSLNSDVAEGQGRNAWPSNCSQSQAMMHNSRGRSNFEGTVKGGEFFIIWSIYCCQNLFCNIAKWLSLRPLAQRLQEGFTVIRASVSSKPSEAENWGGSGQIWIFSALSHIWLYPMSWKGIKVTDLFRLRFIDNALFLGTKGRDEPSEMMWSLIH